MVVVSLIKFAIGLVGLLLTFIYLIVAVVNKHKRGKLKTAAVVFFSTAGLLIAISIIEFFVYSSNEEPRGVVIKAYREAPIGGVWLALYEDSTWELRNSSREIRAKGEYQITGDTVTMIAEEGYGIANDVAEISFLIKKKRLIETSKSGINILEIRINNIDKQGS
ncbi:MAG: hypothetical protein ACFB15_28450 [Cyclobacteriaceae bacterium]